MSEAEGIPQQVEQSIAKMPPLVGSQVFSFEKRSELLDTLGELDLSDEKVKKQAETLLKKLKVQQDHEDAAEQREQNRLNSMVEQTKRGLNEEVTADIEIEADELIDITWGREMTDTLLETFSHDVRYKDFAQYCKNIQEPTAALVDTDSFNKSSVPHLMKLIRNRVSLSDDKSISLHNFLGSSETADFHHLIIELDQKSKLSKSKQQQLSEYVQSIWRNVSTPEYVLKSLIVCESQNLFEEQPSEESKEKMEILSQMLESIDPLVESTRIVQLMDKIDKNQYEQEKKYLRAVVCQKLVQQGRCPAVWASDLASGRDIFEHTTPEQILTELMAPYETIDKKAEFPHKKALYKTCATLILLSILAPNASQFPEISKAVVDALQQKIAQELFIPIPHQEHITDEIINRVPTPTPTPSPTPNSEPLRVTESGPQEKPAIEPLQQNDFSFADSGTNAKSQESLSGNYGVSPEQYKKQSSTIEWIIEGERPKSKYLVNTLLPIYDAEKNTFLSVVDNNIEVHNVPDQIDNAPLRMFSIRKNLPETTIIPAEWGNTIQSAKVDIIKDNIIVRSIPALAGRSESGQNILKFDTQAPEFALQDGEQYQVSVGLAPEPQNSFDSAILNADHDTQFSPMDVFPAEVTDLISRLNQDTSLSDVQKLQQLQEWFKSHYTYSFDKKYTDYYLAGDPKPETFLRRVFGTGSSESDPLYNSDPSLLRHGVCGSINAPFAAAARALNLTNGQVFLANGYINSPLYTNFPNTLTQGQYHAWTVYVDQSGNLTHLDATSSNIDQYTKDVIDQINSGPTPAAEMQYPKETFDKKRYHTDPIIEAGRQISITVEAEYDIAKAPGILEKTELQYSEHPTIPEVNSWRVKSNGKMRSQPFIPNPYHIYSDFENGKWKNSFHLDEEYDLKTGFKPEDQNSVSYTPRDGRLTEKDALMVNGIFTLDKNWLPLMNFGEISPQSIKIYENLNINGKEMSHIPISFRLLGSSEFVGKNYVLYFDDPSIVGKTIEIQYQTLENYLVSDTKWMTKDEINTAIKPLIKREELGAEFAQYLNTIETAKTYDEFIAQTKFMTFSEDELSYISIMYDTGAKISNRNKAHLVDIYVKKNFTQTIDPQWRRIYIGDGASASEIVQRIIKNKYVDDEMKAFLTVSALRTMPSSTEEDVVPAVLAKINDYEENYIHFLPTNFLLNQRNDGLFQIGLADDMITPSLLTEFTREENNTTYENNRNLTIYQPQNATWYFNTLTSFEDPTMQYDPITKDAIALALEDHIAHHPENWKHFYNEVEEGGGYFGRIEQIETQLKSVLDNKLSDNERLKLVLMDRAMQKYLDWKYNHPEIFGMYGAAGVAGLLAGLWTSRKTGWWKEFDKKRLDEFVKKSSTASQTGKNTILRELQTIQNLITRPYKIPDGGIRKAIATAFMERRYKKDKPNNSALIGRENSPPEQLRRYAKSGLPIHPKSNDQVSTARHAVHEVLEEPFVQEALTHSINTINKKLVETLIRKGINSNFKLLDFIKVNEEYFTVIFEADETEFRLLANDQIINSLFSSVNQSREINDTKKEVVSYVANEMVEQIIIPYFVLKKAERQKLQELRSKKTAYR